MSKTYENATVTLTIQYDNDEPKTATYIINADDGFPNHAIPILLTQLGE